MNYEGSGIEQKALIFYDVLAKEEFVVLVKMVDYPPLKFIL